jgi:hypothetical protein
MRAEISPHVFPRCSQMSSPALLANELARAELNRRKRDEG